MVPVAAILVTILDAAGAAGPDRAWLASTGLGVDGCFSCFTGTDDDFCVDSDDDGDGDDDDGGNDAGRRAGAISDAVTSGWEDVV